MKFLFTFVLLISTAASFAQTELEMIRDLVDSYQEISRRTYGKVIQIEVREDPSVNAFASVAFGPRLGITTGALYALNDDEVLATMCHELGHLFGARLNPQSSMAPEGEADYFAGFCLVKYLMQIKRMSAGRAQQEAIYIANNESVVYYQAYIYPHRASIERFYGINMRYPNNNCRLYTVIQGVYGYPRPACWYNPQQ